MPGAVWTFNVNSLSVLPWAKIAQGRLHQQTAGGRRLEGHRRINPAVSGIIQSPVSRLASGRLGRAQKAALTTKLSPYLCNISDNGDSSDEDDLKNKEGDSDEDFDM